MIKKILLKILGNDIYQPEIIDAKKMQDWLFKSYKEDGYRNYYTMRKKYLVNLLLLDIPDKERLKTQGRLEELKGLSVNIAEEYKRRKDKNV